MLSPTAIQQIEQELLKYPADKRQSALISALHIVQAEEGYLSNEAISAVAHYLGIPEISAMEVASFYALFNLAPSGRHKITLCTNISCQLRGADTLAQHLKTKLGIDFNQVTADGRFCLKEGECMGACGGAPVLHINNTVMHEHLTLQKIDSLLESLT